MKQSRSDEIFLVFSPASCLVLSQVAMRPRPDHVSFVFGSRYLALTLPLRAFLPLPPLLALAGEVLLIAAGVLTRAVAATWAARRRPG